MPPSLMEFEGFYYDGKSPTRHPVKLRLNPQHLHLIFPDQPLLSWPYSGLRMTRTGSDGPIRLERFISKNEVTPRSVVIEDPEFLAEAHRVAPGALGSFLAPPQRRNLRRALIVLALVLIPPLFFGIWKFGLPVLSDTFAGNIPVAWEEKLGETVYESMFQPPLKEPPPELREALDAISKRLLTAVPKQPYQFHIYVHPGNMVNALALPGGTVVVFQGLINATETPEELAEVKRRALSNPVYVNNIVSKDGDFTALVIETEVYGGDAESDEFAGFDADDGELTPGEEPAFLTGTENAEIVAALKRRFPAIEGPRREDICYATTNRQQAVRAIASECDLVLVVGSKNSSNSVRLTEIAEAAGTPAYLIDDKSELEASWFDGIDRVLSTAGASAPEDLVREIVLHLIERYGGEVEQRDIFHETIEFGLPLTLKKFMRSHGLKTEGRRIVRDDAVALDGWLEAQGIQPLQEFQVPFQRQSRVFAHPVEGRHEDAKFHAFLDCH